jgi:hypothetical protein
MTVPSKLSGSRYVASVVCPLTAAGCSMCTKLTTAGYVAQNRHQLMKHDYSDEVAFWT